MSGLIDQPIDRRYHNLTLYHILLSIFQLREEFRRTQAIKKAEENAAQERKVRCSISGIKILLPYVSQF